MKITLISDTHTYHRLITDDLIGGDILLFTGDLMGSGYDKEEIVDFCEWFDSLDNYKYKIFISGNHDRLFENNYDVAIEIVNRYKNIIYLQDSFTVVEGIKIYGSPWQPEFYNWAFNLPRNGVELESKWEAIPKDTDILLTHGPAWGILDTVFNRQHDKLGCELLTNKITSFEPKIHVCGHIHTGYGYKENKNTHHFNASVLDERYEYTQKPINIEWDKDNNIIDYLL